MPGLSNLFESSLRRAHPKLVSLPVDPRRKVDASLYNLLGVDELAFDDAINSAFRRASLQVHPDRRPDDPAASEKFRSLVLARDLLLDPERREVYDEDRRRCQQEVLCTCDSRHVCLCACEGECVGFVGEAREGELAHVAKLAQVKRGASVARRINFKRPRQAGDAVFSQGSAAASEPQHEPQKAESSQTERPLRRVEVMDSQELRSLARSCSASTSTGVLIRAADVSGLDLLQSVVEAVAPISERRGWALQEVSEMSPALSRSRWCVVGSHEEDGRVSITLRDTTSEARLLPFDEVLVTMLHELVHFEHDGHSHEFYSLYGALIKEACATLSDVDDRQQLEVSLRERVENDEQLWSKRMLWRA
eukprot:CAMPEP_0204155526 /NCGR_PEP_ID=MMETSP0361-20130328/29666_1 /ASSEMBLY_ACC=CAM_ASM_000343 /TAXON_ID=268821 /ORGANISM="Scrippsiella Hangoei, Strain SHTV-5" /LENGTH=363 /DNA_ID=CAMNT_0051111023 /DNA_START=74 /DNA_END=1161 /DNA_ORIENTATION=-